MRQDGDDEGVDIHVMLRAPDDDTAVREALNALAEEGFLEADLDQIGTLTDVPDEEPHASAYQGALRRRSGDHPLPADMAPHRSRSGLPCSGLVHHCMRKKSRPDRSGRLLIG